MVLAKQRANWKNALSTRGLKARILVVEATDKMTDRQTSAKVRERFLVKKVL